MNNLAAEHPGVVKELSELWHTTATEVDRLSKKGTAPVSGKTPPKLAKDGRQAKGKN